MDAYAKTRGQTHKWGMSECNLFSIFIINMIACLVQSGQRDASESYTVKSNCDKPQKAKLIWQFKLIQSQGWLSIDEWHAFSIFDSKSLSECWLEWPHL